MVQIKHRKTHKTCSVSFFTLPQNETVHFFSPICFGTI